jgi:hypothetical protein
MYLLVHDVCDVPRNIFFNPKLHSALVVGNLLLVSFIIISRDQTMKVGKKRYKSGVIPYKWATCTVAWTDQLTVLDQNTTNKQP